MARVWVAVQAAASQIPADRADVLTCSSLEVAAGMARRQHQWHQVARFLSASEALRERLGVSRWFAFQADFDHLAAVAARPWAVSGLPRASAAQSGDLDGVVIRDVGPVR